MKLRCLFGLSVALLQQILEDRTSDRFVAERIWERLATSAHRRAMAVVPGVPAQTPLSVGARLFPRGRR